MHAHLLIYLVAMAVLPAQEEIPPGTEVITLEPKFGTVTFTHHAHSRLNGVECRTCHHTLVEQGTPIRPCHDCHEAVHFREAAIRPIDKNENNQAPGQPVKAQEAFHTLCQGCHTKRKNAGEASGPTDSCRDCHV